MLKNQGLLDLKEGSLSFVMATVKKNVFFNKSLYSVSLFQNFTKFFYNTQVGLLNFNTSNASLIQKKMDFGVLTDFQSNYPLSTSKVIGKKKNNIKTVFFDKIFALSMHSTLKIRKVLILLTLVSFKKYNLSLLVIL